MASAWGASWGSAWGDSWGAITVQDDDDGFVLAFYNANRKKRRIADQNEVLIAVITMAVTENLLQ